MIQNKNQRNTVILAEKLSIASVLYIIFQKKPFRVDYVNYGMFSGFFEKCIRLRGISVRKIEYGDFLGSAVDVCEQSFLFANDKIFTLYKNNIYILTGLEFLKNHDYVLALKLEMLFRFTKKRLKTYIFLNRLSHEHNNLIFLPDDNFPILDYVDEKFITKKYCIPRIIAITNSLKQFFFNLLAPVIFLMILPYIWIRYVTRGISLRTPYPEPYEFGLDMQNIGLRKDRGLDNDGFFFIFDNDRFRPDRILHVVRNKLEDVEARRSFEKYHAAYTESDSLKVPLSYLVKKLTFGLFIILPFRFFCNLFKSSYSAVPLIPVMAVIRMKMEAEILYMYFRIKLFITRDEYSPYHIVRTCVAHANGNHTIGFQWADFFVKGCPLNYLYLDKYLLYGEFYREYHKKAFLHTPTEIIGCGPYWSDHIYDLIQENKIRSRYTSLKEKYFLVGVLGSTFSEDADINRARTIQFYSDTIDILKKYENVYIALKPKSDELDPELNEMIRNHPRICIEKEIWTPRFLYEPDLIICIGDSTIGIESLYLGKKVVFYDVIENDRDLYSRYSPMLVAKNRRQLEKNVHDIITKNVYLDQNTINSIVQNHCGPFDGSVMKRFKNHCYQIVDSTKMDR